MAQDTERIERTAYRVTFERVGRNHNVAPLEVGAIDAEHLAELVYPYVRKHLLSSDVEVVVDLEAMKGSIFCGFNNGGTFTIEAIA